MKKAVKMVAAIGLTMVALFNMTGCTSLAEMILGPIIKDFFEGFPSIDWHTPTFEERCVTTEDGFTYYVDSNDGLCIIDLPDKEEVTIPEYIDGQRVMQLGYEEKGLFYGNTYRVDGQHVKSLTIQHSFKYQYTTSFNALQKITYVDFPYCKVNTGGGWGMD